MCRLDYPERYRLVGVPGYITREFSRTSPESYAFFGEGNFRMLDDKLVFTAGARYIIETKEFVRKGQDLLSGSSTVGPNATNSTGFRSGGLSPRAQDPETLAKGCAPEKLMNWEVGVRTKLLDNRLIFNATAFHMIYNDMQIELAFPSALTGTQLAVDNAGKAEFSDLEFDVEAAVTDW